MMIDPFRVFVYANPDALAAAFVQWAHLDQSAIPVKASWYRTGRSTAEAGWHGVFVNLYASGWATYGLIDRQKILAHELFHLVQQQLENDPSNCGSTPPDQVRACGPTWLIEGSAETMGYRVAAARGLLDLAGLESQLRQRVRGTTLTLASLETYSGQSQAGSWDTMHLAADHLAEIAPHGVQSFLDFWRAIGAGLPWPDAFQSAFGMTVAQYYAAFDAFRASL